MGIGLTLVGVWKDGAWHLSMRVLVYLVKPKVSRI
jgi:hypothetical protein